MEGNDIERKFDKIQSFISAYDLIVQQHASQTGVRVGSSFHFPREFERYPLDLGLEACLGFYISVRPTYQQLMVNINTRMAAFYVPGNLAEAILAFGGELPPWFVKKLQVVTTYRGSSERSTIFNVTNIPPSQAPMFHNEAKKRQMSVAEFLQKGRSCRSCDFRLLTSALHRIRYHLEA